LGAVDDPATQPPFSGYLYDLPRSRAFARSWSAAVATLPDSVRAANPWLVTLEATAAPNEPIQAPQGGKYVLAWGCDPRACRARSIQVAFNVRTGAVAAAAYLDGAWHAFGSGAVDDRATLLASIARARVGLAARFPLPEGGAPAVERFIAAVPAG